MEEDAQTPSRIKPITNCFDDSECLTLTVPQAGRLVGLSRPSSYAAAQRGDMPGLIRIGRRLMVSKVALQRALENGWQPAKT